MIDYNNANDGIRKFASAGIATAVTINAGALVTAVPQLSELLTLLGPEAVKTAFICWAAGVVLAVSSWFFATFSASAFANHMHRLELVWFYLAAIVGLSSLAAFLGGFLHLTSAFM